MLRAARVELAELQSRDCGKPCGDSCGGVDAGIGAIEQYAELGPLHRGHSLQGSPFAHDAMIREPRGVVAILVPWNDPVAVVAGQLAAALAAGNAVVFKPSERTPLCSARLAELFRVELPDGVLEVVVGDARAGRPLVAHPGVDVVLHTGSVTTGREIARVCGERGAKALLEVGGRIRLSSTLTSTRSGRRSRRRPARSRTRASSARRSSASTYTRQSPRRSSPRSLTRRVPTRSAR
jgi:succinate-semialdehyde dehydrogenase/glutarate-semialdehyde dehydrogenase